MSKTISLNLNSLFAFNNSKSDPNFFLRKSFNNVSHVKISEVNLTNEFYTFDSRNNWISFKEGSGNVVSFQITSGNYTSSSLVTTLKSLLEANSQNTRTYTVTYSSSTAKLTITINTGTFTFLNISNNAYYELALSNSLDSAASSFVTDPIDLSGVKIINLVTSSFGGDISNLVGSNYNSLACIPVNNSFLSVLNYSNSNEFLDVDISSLQNVSFSFLDERLRKLTLTKDFQLTLLLKINEI